MGVGCDWVVPTTRPSLESRFSYVINAITTEYLYARITEHNGGDL